MPLKIHNLLSSIFIALFYTLERLPIRDKNYSVSECRLDVFARSLNSKIRQTRCNKNVALSPNGKRTLKLSYAIITSVQ